MQENDAMKRVPIWWLNIPFVLGYMFVALFINLNNQVFGLSVRASKVLIGGLLLAGVGVALYSLATSPKQWVVPVVCLGVYLTFVL